MNNLWLAGLNMSNLKIPFCHHEMYVGFFWFGCFLFCLSCDRFNVMTFDYAFLCRKPTVLLQRRPGIIFRVKQKMLMLHCPTMWLLAFLFTNTSLLLLPLGEQLQSPSPLHFIWSCGWKKEETSPPWKASAKGTFIWWFHLIWLSSYHPSHPAPAKKTP